MKRPPTILLLFLFGGCFSSSPFQYPSEIHQPDPASHAVLVLYKFDPWNMVIGSDAPQFAVYSDKTVIWRRKNAKSDPIYLTSILSDREYLEMTTQLPLDTVAAFDSVYVTSQCTDQPSYSLMFNIGDLSKRVSIYGPLPGASKCYHGGLPPSLRQALLEIVEFDDSWSTPWLPDQIEVMIWPFDHSIEKPLPWPTAWEPPICR